MCDESDVENSLKSLIIGYLYPNGTAQPSAAGVAVEVVRGWPTTQYITNAQQQSGPNRPGMVIVSVCTRGGIEKNTTRYPLSWQTSVPPVHTLTATVNGSTITIDGTIASPQNVIAFIGGSLAPQAFSYAVQPGDTLNSVASGLASIISAQFPGTTSNINVVTVNSPLPIKSRIASIGTAIQEVGRQDKEFQITIWSPPCNVKGQDADSWRNTVARIIDPPLRKLNRIAMVDGMWARIKFERTITLDRSQSEGLYRRDLFYCVEYATTVTEQAYEVGIAQAQIQPGNTDLPPPPDFPTYITNS